MDAMPLARGPLLPTRGRGAAVPRAAAASERLVQADRAAQQPAPSSLGNGASIRMRSLDSHSWRQDAQPGHSNGNGSARPAGAPLNGTQPRTARPSSTAMQAAAPAVMQAASVPQTVEVVAGPAPREFLSDASFRWAQDDYNSTQRSLQTWAFILTLRARLFLLERKWSYVGGFTEQKKSERLRALAAWTREAVLQLGPTFIKLGQLFSTRSDLYPAEFTEELSQLQDRVPAFAPEKAAQIIERELGAPIPQLFRAFERQPIAAASLGQVHRAQLWSGERVVVKVQRPGLRRLFDIDLANMKQLAAILDKQDSARDFTGIYEECRTILYEEIDYLREGRNADRFRRNFRAQEWVRVPSVFWQFTSRSVITLEYLPGTKISDAAALRASGLDVRQVATRATEAYIMQVIRHGFLHSDPHAGNIAVGPDGRLTFYDFGMMSELSPDVRGRLQDMFYAVYRQDADAVIGCLQDLGIIVPTGDAVALRRTVAFFLQNLNRQAERQETLSAIGEDLFSLAVDQPFRFPATFTFTLRAFSTLEGIGKTLLGKDEYSFAAVAAPYAQELLDLQSARRFALQELGKQAVEATQATAAVPARVARIEGVASALESGSLRLRVRDPASERAFRRSTVMQAATLQAVGAAGLADVGTQLLLAGRAVEAYHALGGAAVLLGCVLYGVRRVRRLDRFEKDLKAGLRPPQQQQQQR